MFAERRFGHATGHGGLNNFTGLTFYRTREREGRVPEYPLVASRPRPLQSTSSAVTSFLNSQQTTSLTPPADISPLSLIRYGGVGQLGAMNASIPSVGGGINLDPIRTSLQSVPNAGTARSAYRSSQLCRCGSGGALPGQQTSTSSVAPPLQSGSPPAVFAPPASSFRTVQSLPSSPNTNRRPITPPTATPAGNNSAITSRPSDHRPFIDPSRPEHFSFGTSGSESAALAADPETGRIGGQFSMRFRSSSQPLAKLSSFVIVLLAIIIIGFIVLSPVFHYAM